jgi:hypothetical protein
MEKESKDEQTRDQGLRRFQRSGRNGIMRELTQNRLGMAELSPDEIMGTIITLQ